MPLHQNTHLSDGTVRCLGANDLGQLGLGTSGTPSRDAVTVPGLSDVEQVLTVNISVTCTRHRDGTVRCWGSNEFDMLGTGTTGTRDAPSRDAVLVERGPRWFRA